MDWIYFRGGREGKDYQVKRKKRKKGKVHEGYKYESDYDRKKA